MSFLDFDRKPIFDGVQISDKQFDKSNTSKKETNIPKRSPKKPIKT